MDFDGNFDGLFNFVLHFFCASSCSMTLIIDSLGSTSTPAVLCPCIPIVERNIQLHTFWFKPVSYFGLFSLNEAYGDSVN